MQAVVTVESAVVESPRVQQVRGLFDLAAEKTSRLQWTAALPIEERPWNIGLITGPSGCGKSTLARHFWPRETLHSAALSWPRDRALTMDWPAPGASRRFSGGRVDQRRDGSAFGGRLFVAAGVAAAVPRPVHRPAIPRHARPPAGRSAGVAGTGACRHGRIHQRRGPHRGPDRQRRGGAGRPRPRPSLRRRDLP